MHCYLRALQAILVKECDCFVVNVVDRVYTITFQGFFFSRACMTPLCRNVAHSAVKNPSWEHLEHYYNHMSWLRVSAFNFENVLFPLWNPLCFSLSSCLVITWLVSLCVFLVHEGSSASAASRFVPSLLLFLSPKHFCLHNKLYHRTYPLYFCLPGSPSLIQLNLMNLNKWQSK